jgi:hypothetical protein
MRSTAPRRSWWITAAALLLAVGTASAHWAMPTDAPVDRLVTNLGKYAEEHPKEAGAWYRLGRVHSLAYAKKWRSVQVFERDKSEPSELAPDWMQNRWQEKPDEKPYTEQELREHLSEAIRCFNKAIELDGAQAEYFHSLAYIVQQGLKDAPFVKHVVHPTPASTDNSWSAKEGRVEAEKLLKSPGDAARAMEIVTGHSKETWGGDYLNPTSRTAMLATLLEAKDRSPEQDKAIARVVEADWKEQVGELYFKALSFSLPDSSRVTRKPIRGVTSLLPHQSATAYIEAVKSRGERASDKVRLDVAKATIKSLESLPENNAITPIVLPLDYGREMSSLLSPGSSTGFDLDGTGRSQRWPWLNRDTGVLAWNPSGDGRIDSGRQLFGSVTWWIFFDDGYQALDALDDNRDGRLSGSELNGLVVWTDRNGDGVSDKGEVTPVATIGIVSLSCRANATDSGCPASADGARFADGRVLPTYDWITEPLTDRRPPLPAMAIAGATAISTSLLFAQRRRSRAKASASPA